MKKPGSRLSLFLASRFALSTSSSQFMSLITWIAVTGVSLGVLALIVVTSVINGFEGELSRVITSMNADVILYTRGKPVPYPAQVQNKVLEVLGEKNVHAISSTLMAELMVAGEGGITGGVLEGVEAQAHSETTEVFDRIVSGSAPEGEDEILVGEALAEKIGATIGSRVKLIIPFVGDADENGNLGQPRSESMRVVGIVRMGMHQYDSKFLFAPLPAVQKFLKQKGRASAFKIKLVDRDLAQRSAQKLTEFFGYPLRAKDWSSLNRNLLYSIRVEKAVIAVILTAIMFVAAFNVVSTLMMMIHDKTREIAILKTMGFEPSQAFWLFVFIGGSIGFIGVGLGLLLGLLLNTVIANTRLIHLPADVYSIDFLPVVERWSEIGLIAGFAVVVTLVATLYPARQVAKRAPLEGIREG